MTPLMSRLWRCLLKSGPATTFTSFKLLAVMGLSVLCSTYGGCGTGPSTQRAVSTDSFSDVDPNVDGADATVSSESEPVDGDPAGVADEGVVDTDILTPADAGGDPVLEARLTVRADGFYRAGVRVLPQFIVGLPEGVSVAEAIDAGFDGTEGFGAPGDRWGMLPPLGSDVEAFVSDHDQDPHLLGWVGPDEPLWNGRTIEEVRTQVVTPLRAVDAERPLLLNHAPRGSQAEPANFQLLAPWLALSDVLSMDIYPVPEGNGHSILAAHPGLSAVGAHADLLRELVAGSEYVQPFLLVLQGAGLGRLAAERWEHLELWTDLYGARSAALRGAAACDLDGDGAKALVVALGDESGDRLEVYDFVDSPFGEHLAVSPLPPSFGLAGLKHMLCADTDGDARDDLLLLVDDGPTHQDFWVAASSSGEGLAPALRYRAAVPDVDFAAIRHAVTGDLDGDGCADLVVSYDYPDGQQSFLGLMSSCQAFPAAATYPAVPLYTTNVAALDLEAWPKAAVADLDADGLADLMLGQTIGATTSVIAFRATTSGYTSPTLVYSDTTAQHDLIAGFVAAARVQGDAAPALVFGQGAGLTVVPAVQAAPGFGSPDTWYGPGDLDVAALLAHVVGDCDGDGHDDVALLDATATGGVRVRLATSTGRYFGARDPQLPELRYMWWSALAHGASAVVTWGQSFSTASEAPWARLRLLASESRLLSSYFAGTTLKRETQAGVTAWWVEGSSDSLYVLVLNDTRVRRAGAATVMAPSQLQGAQVSRWSSTLRTFVEVSAVSVQDHELTDLEPLGPYEVRAYRVAR